MGGFARREVSAHLGKLLELSLLPLGFIPSLTVASRLLHPYSTENKTLRLMVKQLSTARNTRRDSQLYREESREEEDRGNQEEKKESQKGREHSSQQ